MWHQPVFMGEDIEAPPPRKGFLAEMIPDPRRFWASVLASVVAGLVVRTTLVLLFPRRVANPRRRRRR